MLPYHLATLFVTWTLATRNAILHHQWYKLTTLLVVSVILVMCHVEVTVMVHVHVSSVITAFEVLIIYPPSSLFPFPTSSWKLKPNTLPPINTHNACWNLLQTPTIIITDVTLGLRTSASFPLQTSVPQSWWARTHSDWNIMDAPSNHNEMPCACQTMKHYC